MTFPLLVVVALAVVGGCRAETCLEGVARVEARPMPGAEVPQCEEDGSYKPIQYSGSQAVCVTAEGERIGRYGANRWETEGMHCKCARREHAYQQTGMMGLTFNCDSKGNFEAVQCIGSRCGCHDSHGQAHPDKPWVHIGRQHELNCEAERPVRTCQDHAAEVRANPMPGREIPFCEVDSPYYSAKQYRGSMSICVTKNNERIGRYGVHRWEDDGMDCECARLEYESERARQSRDQSESEQGSQSQDQSQSEEREFHCDERGNFIPQ